MIVYAPWHGNLGDQIATINLLLHRQVHIPCLLHSPPHLRLMHLEILTELGVRYDKLLTDAPATAELNGFDVWATPYFPALKQWDADESHEYCAYHFAGTSTPELKNPPPHEERLLLAALWASGFKPIPLGLPYTIAQQVDILAHSAFCLAVDSGPSHLAHMTGTPLFLLQYQLPVVTCHRGKEYILCEGFEDWARHKGPTWADCQRFIGRFDGARFTYLPRNERDALDRAGSTWWVPKA
jgi:hypothetical protein